MSLVCLSPVLASVVLGLSVSCASIRLSLNHLFWMSTSTSVGVVSAFPLFFTVCYFSPAATRLLSETKKSRHTGKNRPKVKNNASFHGTLHDNELTYVRHRRPAKQNGRQTHKQTVTDRQTHKQTVTDTQTNRQRQTDKQTETDRHTNSDWRT